MSTIYRYKFSDNLIEKMMQFASIHRYDDRETFKEAYLKWKNTDDIKEIINKETERLQNSGYQEDIDKKIYHSLRYYFSKRKFKNMNCTSKTERKNQYDKRITQDVLNEMDRFIERNINEKPSVLYHAYINIYKHDIDNTRLKKAFKNKMYNKKKHHEVIVE